MLLTRACLNPPPSHNKDRRAVAEKARTLRVKRIQQDIRRVAKRETEFSKSLVLDIIPFRVVWNEDALDKLRQLKDLAPFKIEQKENVEFSKVEVDDHDEFDY